MGLPAARVGDEVAHSNAMMELLIRAALGAALAVAVVATGFNDRELAAIQSGKLDPAGVSVIRASSPEEAASIWNSSFPNRPATDVAEASAEGIRGAGYDVIHNPSRGGLKDAHARLIHPDGVEAFDANKQGLRSAFGQDTC